MTVYINGVAQSSGGAPTDADYLVGTAQGDLSAEIVAGAAPAGELGGTWASPTVDGTHSGSAHHAAETGDSGTHTHTTYILHSLATALNDVLMASGAGVFVKQTLAQLKTALAIAADIATHAAISAASTHGSLGHAESHTTPAMTATVAGHVPTPPNNTTTFLRGDGTFAAPGIASHGAVDHTDRTRRMSFHWAEVVLVNGVITQDGWTLRNADYQEAAIFGTGFVDRASDSLDVVYATIEMPMDMVSGSPAVRWIWIQSATSTAQFVWNLNYLELLAGGTDVTGAGTDRNVTDTGITLNVLDTVTLATTISLDAQDYLRLTLSRDPTNGSDLNTAAFSPVHTARLSYTADM